jgi:RNA polymerase sigma-54 factor
MHPLTLHEVAEIVGLNESTVSRVTTKKYMHTPQGLFQLKYFFASKLTTDAGVDCSSTTIKAIIKQLVSKETVKQPLSDKAITEIMNERGIHIARRTVAKYRESLGIQSSNQRKT